MFRCVTKDDLVSLVERSTTSLSRLISNGTSFATADLPFVHYFMRKFPRDPWSAELAYSISRFLLEQASMSDVLHHATISIAALLATRDPLGQPEPTEICMYRHLEHKQSALQLLQKQLKSSDINPYIPAAIALLLLGEMGGPQSKVHLQGLKLVLEHLQNTPDTKQHILFREDPGSPLIWISLAAGIRFDIGLAVLEGDPILDPLPLTVESESTHSSWVSQISVSAIVGSKTTEFGIAIFTLRVLLHRAFHVAREARNLRQSPDYSPEQELKIQTLCSELEADLERWISKPVIQQGILEETNVGPARPSAPAFLHYDPIEPHWLGFHNLINEYRTTALYISFIRYPEMGPGPTGSKRFQLAVDMCRIMVSDRTDSQWSPIANGGRLFQLFLCCLVFGGEDFYPLESKAALAMFQERIPESWGIQPEDLLDRWSEKFPGLPPLKAFSSLDLDGFDEPKMEWPTSILALWSRLSY